MLIFHLHIAIHFYPVCSMCALQQKLCNAGISIKILFFNNRMWHTKNSHSWEQGRSSRWVQVAVCMPPSQLCGESAKIPQGPLNCWQWLLGMLCTYDQSRRKPSLVPPEKQSKQSMYKQALAAILWRSAPVLVTSVKQQMWPNGHGFLSSHLQHITIYLLIYLFTI